MAQRTLPPIHPPVRLWRQYERRLRQHLLDPIANAMAKRIKEAADSYVAVQAAIAQYDAANAPSTVSDAEAWAKAMRDHHRKKFDTAIARHFGIRVMPLGSGMPWEQAIQAAIIANIDLIKTIPPRYHMALKNEIAKLVTDKPFDRKAISSALRKSYKIGGYNVRRIARDQTNKLIGKLTQEKQTYIGIEMYEWYTAMDERVREMHAQNHGLKFRWDKPPATGHPGEEIQCRCVALAVIDTSRHRRGALPSPATPARRPRSTRVPPIPRARPQPKSQPPSGASVHSPEDIDAKIQEIMKKRVGPKGSDDWLREFAEFRFGAQSSDVLDGDAFKKLDGIFMSRAVGRPTYVNANITDKFVGRGNHGSGMYYAAGKNGAERVMDNYMSEGGWMYTAKLRRNAKVIDYSELMSKHMALYNNARKRGVEISKFDEDPGRFAARLGYDAIIKKHKPNRFTGEYEYVVVLNKRMVVVDKRFLPTGELARKLSTARTGTPAWEREMAKELKEKYDIKVDTQYIKPKVKFK